ncbi:MAG: hypothetical protein IJZ08_10015 [Clostridia bacterium]|nr:hypothetical protein [Clostridia bacterium]
MESLPIYALYILAVLSTFAGVIKNCLTNHAAKNTVTSRKSLWQFNAVVCLVAFLVFLISALGNEVSGFTLALGLVFGIVTVLQAVFNMVAFNRGPLHITTLIITASMIVPAMYDAIITRQMPSAAKLIAIAVLFIFIVLSLGKKDETTARRGWLFFCGAAFVMSASIGILQKIHQGSAYKAETAPYLACAFLGSTVFAFVMSLLAKKPADSEGKPSRMPWITVLIAAVCGVCMYINHDFNLKLSGLLPSEIFFPLVNGGLLFLNTLSALVIFKEKLTKQQVVGLIGGGITLVLLCILK